jgi:processive 1,2-diacylglycerol beta-glucosyltransferase
MSRILFLYATGNSGHQKAAEAIQKSLRHADPDVATFGIDFFTYHYPTLGPFLFRIYLEILQSIPHTWDYIYDNKGLATLTTELRQFFNYVNTPKLHALLHKYEPRVIVCTQAIPAGFIAAEKQKGRISVPLLVTVTDFVANPYWPVHNVNLYFVPDEDIKGQLMARHIPEERIAVTGIPIDRTFGQCPDSRRVR